jgi:hypothetical protein
MATYYLLFAEKEPNSGSRARSSMRFTVLWLLAMLFLERVAHGNWGYPIAWIITGAICFLGGLLTRSLWPPKLQSFAIRIDDFGIRSFWNGKPLRKIMSSRVHYVRERRGISGIRLMVSEESSWLKRQFSTRSVSIPKRLAQPEEYEQIKAMTLGWLQASEQ